MGNVFKRMRHFQITIRVSVGITFITKMEKTTKILIRSVLLLRISVHRRTIFTHSFLPHIKSCLQKPIFFKGDITQPLVRLKTKF